jgi:16S rRNA (cytidine1402-2'-O)-methyltransferase
MSGIIYVVGTPIGNMGDITLRALEVLKNADLVLCEDTRVTKNLLDHFQIQHPLVSYHQHSDARKVKEIRELLAAGKNIALVTDAGTPGISDPGNALVRELTDRDDEIKVIPVPGPSAVTSALGLCGFPAEKFTFLGFPPHKTKRQKFFKEVAAAEHVVVFFESSHRITKCIQELAAVLDPKRRIVICREMTKKFETIYRGTIADIAQEGIDERGEFVLVINNK